MRDQPDPNSMVVYGLGSVGQGIVDDLLADGTHVDLILDRGKRGQSYRNIPILAIEDAGDGRLADRTVLLGLHNHYVDIKKIHAELLAAGVARVLTPIHLPVLAPNARTRPAIGWTATLAMTRISGISLAYARCWKMIKAETCSIISFAIAKAAISRTVPRQV